MHEVFGPRTVERFLDILSTLDTSSSVIVAQGGQGEKRRGINTAEYGTFFTGKKVPKEARCSVAAGALAPRRRAAHSQKHIL